MGWLEMAESALLELSVKNNGAHVDIIAEKLKSLYSLNETVEQVSEKLANNLSLAVNKKSKTFDRVYNKADSNGKKSYKRGWYKLKKSIPVQAPEIINKEEQGSKDERLHTQFIGKAGEYAVMSELLFRKFNASIMTVDDGIDIVASRGEKYFHIQVKTSQQSSKEIVGRFTIQESSFNAASGSQTYYIFIIRKEQPKKPVINDFIILPNNMMKHYKNNKTISSSSNKMGISISIDSNGRYMLNKKEDVSVYVNNFDLE